MTTSVSIRSALVAVSVALVALPRVASSAPREGLSPSSAFRVSTLSYPIKLKLSASMGQLALSTGTTVKIDAAAGAAPSTLTLEQGEAVATIEARPGSPPVQILCGSVSLKVKAGTVAVWRSPAGDRVAAMNLGGEIQTTIGSATVAFPSQQLLAEPRPAGGVIDAELLARQEGWKTLAAALAGKPPTGWLTVPGTVPPSEPIHTFPQEGVIQWVPVSWGGAATSVPREISKLASESLPSTRERFLVTMPGEGLGGTSFLLELGASSQFRAQNTVWVGAGGVVRFFLSREWLVSLVPGTVLSMDGPLPRGADRSPLKLHLASGAMLLEGRTLKLPEMFGLPELSGGTIVMGGGVKSAVGSRQVLVVAGRPEGAEAQIALSRLREALRSSAVLESEAKAEVKTNAGVDKDSVRSRVSRLSLLCQLPLPAESLGRYLPLAVHSNQEVKQIEISAASIASSGAIPAGLMAFKRGPFRELLPVAAVVPAEPALSAGATPGPFAAFLTQQRIDPWTLLSVADSTAARVPGLLHDVDSSRSGGTSQYVFLGFVVLALLVLVPGGASRGYSFLSGLIGAAKLLCPRCGQILDRYPVGEFALSGDQGTVREILRYESLTEICRQEKSLAFILDHLRIKESIDAKDGRVSVCGRWCQRCLGGSISVQMVIQDRVVDETDWPVASAEAHKLLESIQRSGRV